jgi:hypothetical protein
MISYPRLTITFSEDEQRGLAHLVETDVRPPKDVIRWLLHRELDRRGLWPSTEIEAYYCEKEKQDDRA